MPLEKLVVGTRLKIGGSAMANYNSGKKYNFSARESGFNYNSAVFMITLRLTEPLIMKDSVKLQSVNILASEQINLIVEYLLNTKFALSDTAIIKELKYLFSSDFYVSDNFNINDNALKVAIAIALSDQFSSDEKIKLISELFSVENITMLQEAEIEAYVNGFDEDNIIDLSPVLNASIYDKDIINMTDKDPKKAISDFYITKSDDGIYDLIMPFNLIVDYSMTHIGFMPECVDTSTEMQGVDGEIVQDSVYKSRIFDIFAVTLDGLNMQQKSEIKRDIAYILDSIKKDTKKLTFADRETSFDVKYSGLADITTEAPGWLRFEIPLKSASSYGHKEFSRDLAGSGLLVNDGDKTVGALHKITGECVNPSFAIGGILMNWNGTVNEGETLYIDTDNYTCYLIDKNGERHNAMKNYNGNFPRIPIGTIVLDARPGTEEHLYTEWRELILY